MEKKIWQAADSEGITPEIYVTKCAGDGGEFARFLCESYREGSSDVVRLYACGGDGTLNEVVNGIVGIANAEVANIPVGTGNDFIRNFDDGGDFSDISAQIRGVARDCDLIKYSGTSGGRQLSGYVDNMFNIGFDCNVVDMTANIKNKPLVNGALAYLVSVGIMLAKKQGADLNVTFDDGEMHEGQLLLIAIANGCYCGGGVKGIPKASVDDGLIDVSLVHDMPRRTFIKLFPKYSKGTHLETKKGQELVLYKKTKRLSIEPRNGQMKLCADGEISMVDRMGFEIAPRAFRFVVPSGTYKKAGEEKEKTRG